MIGDSSDYLNLAKGFESGQGFGILCDSGFQPESYRMPAYPLFLTIIKSLFGESLLAIIIIQSLLFLASVYFVWQITVKFFGERTGIIFLTLSLFYPFAAMYAVVILSEIIAIFFISLAFFLLSKERAYYLFFSGIAFGLAFYSRPNLLFLSIFITVLCFVLFKLKQPKYFLIALATILTIIPFCFYNYQHFGKFTPTPVAVQKPGTSLFLATWQSKVSMPTLVEFGGKGNFTDEARAAGLSEQVENIQNQLRQRLGSTEKDGTIKNYSFGPAGCADFNEKVIVQETLYNAAIENIKSNPLEYLISSLYNAFRMWFTAFSSGGASKFIETALMFEGILILALALMGIIIALFNHSSLKNKLYITLIAALFYHSATLCWLHTEARYTIPVRLFLLIFAAYAINEIINLLQRKFGGMTN